MNRLQFLKSCAAGLFGGVMGGLLGPRLVGVCEKPRFVKPLPPTSEKLVHAMVTVRGVDTSADFTGSFEMRMDANGEPWLTIWDAYHNDGVLWVELGNESHRCRVTGIEVRA